MADLGTLFVKIDADTKDYNKKIDQTGKRSSNFAKNLGNTFKTGAKVASAALLGIAVASAKLASDAEEINAKFNTAFKGIEGDADRTAEALSKNFGIARSTAEDLLGSTGDLVKGFGATATEALDTSNEIQQLAIDLASYNNLQGGATQASEILTKAFLGERDSLVSLGIKISDADVKQRLLEKGQEDLTGQSLLLARGQATLELAMQQSGDAMGDFARTQDSVANQSRQVQERAKGLAVTLGTQLLPFINKALTVTLDWTESLKEQAPVIKGTLQKAWVEFSSNVQVLLARLTGGFKTFGSAIKESWIVAVTSIQIAFNNLATTIVTNVLGAVSKFLNVAAKLPFVGEKFGEVKDSVDNLTNSLNESNKASEEQKNTVIRAAQEEQNAVEQSVNNQIQNIENLKIAKLNEIDSSIQASKEEQNVKNTVAEANIEAATEETEEKLKLNEEYQEKLFEQSATELELLEADKEAAILNAQEKGLTIFEIEQFYANEIDRVKTELAEKDRLRREEENKQRIDAAVGTAQQIISILGNIQQIELNNIESRKNADIEALEDQGLSKEEYEEKVKQIEKEAALESWKVQKELHNTQKAASLVQAGINIAEGITRALASAPPPFNAILAGITAAAGAVQIGLISSQPAPPRPKLATGAFVAGSSRGTEVIVGEDGDEEIFGMGSRGIPRRRRFASEVAEMVNKSGGGTSVYNFTFTGSSLLSRSELDQFARRFYDSDVREKQRRGVLS